MSRDPDHPKPDHLAPPYGQQFADEAVVRAYRCRPPYASETVDVLLRHVVGDAADAAVLEVGCGTGDFTHMLAPRVARIDAVEPASRMLEVARDRLARDESVPRDRVRFIESGIETAAVQPPYQLAVAAESLHWTEWSVSLPLIARSLVPGGRLVCLARTFEPRPWDDDMEALYATYSTNRDYEAYDLIEELESRGLFRLVGQEHAAPASFEQTVDEFIESCHSRNGFSRDRMEPAAADEFDAAVRELLAPHCHASPRGPVFTIYVGTVLDVGIPVDPTSGVE